MKNEQKIKSAIVAGHDAGRCDREGNHIRPADRGPGKGDRNRIEDKEAFNANYDLIDWRLR